MNLKKYASVPLLYTVIFLLLILSEMINFEKFGAGENIYLSLVLVQLALMFLPCLFFCRMKGKDYHKKLQLHSFGITKGLFALFGVLVMISGNALINLILYKSGLLSLSTGTSYSTSFLSENGIHPDFIYSLIALCVVPAILEELLFRGIFVAEYQRYGTLFTVLLSSFFFALMHLDLPAFPTYFFSGLLLAWAILVTRSLFITILIHIGNNIFNVFLESYLWKLIQQPDSWVLVFLLIACVLLFSALMFGQAERIYAKYCLEHVSAPEKIDRTIAKKARQTIVLSPLYLMCILLFLVVIIN